jgi:hypothetical protein
MGKQVMEVPIRYSSYAANEAKKQKALIQQRIGHEAKMFVDKSEACLRQIGPLACP